jgi:ABC-2 type transport system permease protein
MVSVPHYKIELTTSNSSIDKLALLQSVIRESVNGLNEKIFPNNLSAANITVTKIPGRIYRQIDFILPGQLGFSLLMAGVFGSAFLLFNLRQSFVLKRFFATPVKRGYLILGELLSRLFFQVIGFIIMVSLGYFVFNFTLVNGMATFLEMLLFSILGLLIFMGIGFIISSIIENESSIAPVANTITLPQILLCGLFFSIESYPHWLQAFCKILPLTFFVDGLRKIAFEGTHIWQMPIELGGLFCWTIIIGIITVKSFRWD